MGLFSSFKRTNPSGRARPAAAAEPFRRADLTAVPAGAGWHAVHVRGEGEQASIWPAFAIDFLAECGEFRTLAGHLRKYSEYHGVREVQMGELRGWAERMVAAGLLVPASALVERCMATPGSPAKINVVGIPSGGDEERLRRVITSFAQNGREHGRKTAFSIVTNSSGEKLAGVKRLAEALAAAERVEIAVTGGEEQGAFARRLAGLAGVDPQIVQFGLGDPHGAGFACGANRNGLLLRHAGAPFLSVDDDVACEMASAPEPAGEGGLLVFSSRDAFERWFHADYAAAFAEPKVVHGDYLSLHEKMLGRGVGELLREAKGEGIAIKSMTDEMLRRMQETEGRIVATFTGHYGHPGVPTSYYYLTYRRETLDRLTRDGEEAYRAYLASGAVCALVPRMAIADASMSPGMAIGVDARALLPPFPPVMHAEDFVWGAAVWQCCASGFAGHLPVAVRHDPGLGRGLIAPPLSEEIEPVAIWEFAHILRAMLMGWTAPPGEVDTARRMEGLGRHLCDIAGAPAAEFREYLSGFVLGHESDKIAYAEECLARESNAPDYWRRDVEEYIEQTRQALAAPDFDIPYDMRPKGTAQEMRALIQRLVHDYGRLLQAWPALVRAAQTINS